MEGGGRTGRGYEEGEEGGRDWPPTASTVWPR